MTAALGLSIMAAGFLLLWSAYYNRSPVEELRTVLTGSGGSGGRTFGTGGGAGRTFGGGRSSGSW